MGKVFEINIGEYFGEKVSKIIRDKEDIIILLLETIRMFLIGNITEDEKKIGKVKLKIDKMSRLVYEIQDKYFSFNFPFSIEKTESSDIEYRIYDTSLGFDIDSKIISVILGLLSDGVLNKNSLEEIYYELACSEDISGNNYNVDDIWNLLRKLTLFESGYIRYDYDPDHQDGYKHPLHHFDIYFSSGNTFKIGLDNKITIEDFIDVLDIQTECHYLKRIK